MYKKQTKQKGHFHTLFADVQRDDETFYNFIRMLQSTFDEVFTICWEKLTKKDTRMKTSKTLEEKLVITIQLSNFIRYLFFNVLKISSINFFTSLL